MKILFRTDASLTIGTGHVMRCLTLARVLRDHGAEVSFACRLHPGNMVEMLHAAGFPVHALPLTDRIDAGGAQYAPWLGAQWQEDADALAPRVDSGGPTWVIVDHYGLDQRFERVMADVGGKVMVIDDLADRQHDCALLLDQTHGRIAQDYAGLVPPEAVLLCGSHHALLRPEFAAAASGSLDRRQSMPPPRRIMVTLGGVDADNVTGRVLDALDGLDLPPECRIDVVLGAAAPWSAQITARADAMRHVTLVHRDIADMAGLTSAADLAIGAAGSTAWERCCLGLPSLMVVIADNQKDIAQALDTEGAAISLGSHHAADFVPRLRASVTTLLESPARLLAMTHRAVSLVDGRGAERVAQALLELS